MRIVNKNISWGKYVRQQLGDDAYLEYRKEYKRIWRYKRKSGFDLNVSREAAAYVLYGETKISKAVELTKGITNITEVKRISDLNRLDEFISKNKNIEIYGTKYTVGEVSKLYEEGKISREEFIDYISLYKKSPYYLVNGS